MKIYAARMYDADMGALLSWHSSKREAQRKLSGFARDRGEPPHGPEGVELHEIPLTRAGVIEFLNTHLTSDNS